MKTRIITLITLTALVLGTQHADAKIRRVGYWGTPVTNVDYTDLQSAHDAAAAGDTILIYPGSWNATYSKKLITIGYGYFTDTATLGTQANPALQNIKGTLSVQVYLAAGSSNCTFEGLDGINIYGDGSGASLTGVIIRRCKGQIDFEWDNVYSNWQILQCYLDNLALSYFNTGNGGTISNLTVNNSYIAQMSTYGTTTTSQNGQFNNCVFSYADFNNGSFILKNNIFGNYHNSDANCVYQYNMFNTGYGIIAPGTGNIGVDDAAMSSTVFVGVSDQGTYSNDGRFALKAGSPAKGKGQSGADMGIYGGTNPYKLSGIPRIPAIYKLTAPSNTTSGNPYTITLSVRSNN